MRCLFSGLLLLVATGICVADEPTLEDDRKFLSTTFNWVQDLPATKPGGMVLNFAGGIFLEHAVEDGQGKLDPRRLAQVAYELTEVNGKRIIALKEKNDKLTNLTYTLKNDRLIIEEGECNLHGKTSLKGKWQRWLGDYFVSGNPHWPCPSAKVSDQLTWHPLAMFMAHQQKEGKPKYAYLIIFKIPTPFPKIGGKDTFGSTGKEIFHNHTFEVDGKKFELDYKVLMDPKTGLPGSDFLTLGNTVIKEGEPRLFVADMTGEKTVYHPVKLDLPHVSLDLSKEALRKSFDEAPPAWYRPLVSWVIPVMDDIEALKKKSPELRIKLGK
jgi:hypothetical protein